MRKDIWTNYVENEEVLHTVNGKKYILHTVKRKKGKGNWIGYIFCMNCPLKHVTE